ncbi:hypothetical protein DPMN_161239, partial [Dreissena polymorpha]
MPDRHAHGKDADDLTASLDDATSYETETLRYQRASANMDRELPNRMKPTGLSRWAALCRRHSA